VVAGAFRGRYYKDGVRQDQFGSVAGKTKQMLELRKDEKTNTVTTVQKDNVLTKDNVYWRKLTPVECERLQTVPDNYTNHVSNTQRYKMLGNGWTIETIAHILKNMETK
jgi:site-specific DNA-cytosine methylase